MSLDNKICTNIPSREPIWLKAWYKEFEWYYPDCEPLTKLWFVENAQSDWNIIDCGANIGYYSILFSQLSPKGCVYAIEPTCTVEMLKKNLKFNMCENVSIHQIAVGKESGEITDNIYRIWGEKHERKKYEFKTLDDFVNEVGIKKLDCIKIDVDSFDFEVLQGAENTLIRFDPYVVVELHHALDIRNQFNMQALEWMSKLGYKKTLCLEYENFVFKKDASFTGSNQIEILFQS